MEVEKASPLPRAPIESSAQLQRLNFLLQSAVYVHDKNPQLSRYFIRSMRELAKKHVIPIDRGVKRLFCKSCNSILVPGLSEYVEVAISPNPITAGANPPVFSPCVPLTKRQPWSNSRNKSSISNDCLAKNIRRNDSYIPLRGDTINLPVVVAKKEPIETTRSTSCNKETDQREDTNEMKTRFEENETTQRRSQSLRKLAENASKVSNTDTITHSTGRVGNPSAAFRSILTPVEMVNIPEHSSFHIKNYSTSNSIPSVVPPTACSAMTSSSPSLCHSLNRGEPIDVDFGRKSADFSLVPHAHKCSEEVFRTSSDNIVQLKGGHKVGIAASIVALEVAGNNDEAPLWFNYGSGGSSTQVGAEIGGPLLRVHDAEQHISKEGKPLWIISHCLVCGRKKKYSSDSPKRVNILTF